MVSNRVFAMLTLIERVEQKQVNPSVVLSLALTAQERTRSRYRFDCEEGTFVLSLPRGTVLQDGDLLRSPTGELVKIVAKPEPVLTVTAKTPLLLLQAAYHLGNRHVFLEICSDYLRLSPDSVLQKMLEQKGLTVNAEVAPFHPEIGAYQ